MYGVYNRNEDEMFIMSQTEVFNYLQKNSALFQNFGVETNGEHVAVYDMSAPEHRLGEDVTIDEFFDGFEEDEDILIKPIKK